MIAFGRIPTFGNGITRLFADFAVVNRSSRNFCPAAKYRLMYCYLEGHRMTPEERVARIKEKLEEFGVRFDIFRTWSANALLNDEQRIKDYEKMIMDHEIRIHEDEQRWRKLHEMQAILLET